MNKPLNKQLSAQFYRGNLPVFALAVFAALAEANGIRPASLGPRILRTETAGLAAAAALLLMSGDL